LVRIVHADGSARARGRVMGQALAEPLARSLAFYRRLLQAGGISPERLPSLLDPYRATAEQALPELMAEIDGMAEGADAPWWDVFAINAWEELEPFLRDAPVAVPDRCTAFTVMTEDGPLLGHNEQWYAGDAGNVAVVVARPAEGSVFVSPTVAACLPAVGMNSHGLVQSIMSLSADDDGVGIPRVLVSRHALEAADAADAADRGAIEGRAGGYAHMVATADGETCVVETSSKWSGILTGPGAHTNHYLHPDAPSGDVGPGSQARLGRMTQLLAERPPASPDDAMSLLADHEGDPQAVCVHPREGHEEDDAIVFSMVCLPRAGRMWVAAGQPCEAPFEELDLREIMSP
jgi:isopenicillin-N N-acyltransferase like protein